MDDYEVRRTVWDGGVPVEFRLDASEAVLRSTSPYYVILQRIGYFPLVMSKVMRYFSNVAEDADQLADVWLECDGVPLKWQYPIGVLFDLHSAQDELPWKITIRLKDFPDEIVRNSKDTIRNCFMQSLKEADQLKNKGTIVSAMKKEEHLLLFDSLSTEKFDDFWSVNKKLMAFGEGAFLHVPIRFYETGKPFRQILMKPHSDTATELTLLDAAKSAFSDWSESESDLISHGVVVPLDTPLIWLALNLSYPDNFVHILRLKQSPSRQIN